MASHLINSGVEGGCTATEALLVIITANNCNNKQLQLSLPLTHYRKHRQTYKAIDNRIIDTHKPAHAQMLSYRPGNRAYTRSLGS